MTPHIVTADNAQKIADWLRNRGGLEAHGEFAVLNFPQGRQK